MTTISDVARAARVSVATVSRVLNGKHSVNPELSERVLDAAKTLNYLPNAQARSLRRQASEVIALVIPDIENPFFTSMARGVEDAATAAGYSVVLCNTDEDIAKEASYLDIAVAQNMAGVVLVPTSSASDLTALMARGRPIVAVDRTSSEQVDIVITDNRSNGYAATRLLLNAGFSRIACVSGPVDIQLAVERSLGWRDAMQGSGLHLDDYLRHTSFRPEGGRKAVAELLDAGLDIDAVMLTNNLLGIGALQTLAERGMSEFGISIVGELPYNLLSQTVSQVRLPARQMGITATELLLDRLRGDDRPPRTIVLPGEPSISTPPRSGLTRGS